MTRILIVFTAVLFVFGCANPKQSFNSAANKQLNHIAVVMPVNPKEIMVNIIHHPGAQFGLIGGLIAAADAASKTSQYQEAIKSESIDWAQRAQNKLTESLTASGYHVTQLQAEKRDNGAYLQTYPNNKADAYLDYYFSLSYIAATPTSDYMPSIFLNARLVDAKSKAILYEDRISYGYHHQYGEPVHIPSPSEYLYNDIDILSQNGIQSLEALKEGIQLAVDKIAHHLNKSNKLAKGL